MTSETDHPRQRTVAELLAEHGGGAATGRRSRRRAADGPDDVESSGGHAPGAASTGAPSAPSYGSAPSYDYAPPVTPDRRILREPVPQDDPPPRRAAPEVRRPSGFEAPRETPRRETPTDRMPRIPERAPQRFAEPMAPPAAPAVPPVRPQRPTEGPGGPEQWHRPPTEQARPDDGGPPTQAGALELDDEYDDYDDEYADDYGAPAEGRAEGRYADDDYDDDYDEPRGRARGIAGLRDAEDADELEDDLDDYEDELADGSDERPVGRRAKPEEPSAAQSWGAIVAQWIIGAVGGAALWVAFRFLWRDLMVVAIFAAILVTAGLVLVVRHLLRTTDTRTTAFAVGVGLLLTVSPVVLVLLGK